MKTVVQASYYTLIALWACGTVPVKKWPVASIVSCSSATEKNQKTYEINNNQPKLLFPFPADSILKKPATLAVQIKEVNNPALLPVHCTIGFSNAAQQWQAGNFTLYPPDRPGTFIFRIDKVVAAMLKNGAPAATTPYFLNITLDTTGYKTAGKPATVGVRIILYTPEYKQ